MLGNKTRRLLLLQLLITSHNGAPHLISLPRNYNNGAVAPHSRFRHSHGKDVQSHRKWAKEGESFANRKVCLEQTRKSDETEKRRKKARGMKM